VHHGLGWSRIPAPHYALPRLVFVVDVGRKRGTQSGRDLQNLRREIDLYDSTCRARLVRGCQQNGFARREENLKALQERFPKLQILPTSAAKEKESMP